MAFTSIHIHIKLEIRVTQMYKSEQIKTNEYKLPTSLVSKANTREREKKKKKKQPLKHNNKQKR